MRKYNDRILTDLDIASTSCRKEVIKLFGKNPGVAFTEAQMKDNLEGSFDRTTIYRNTKLLIEKDFIHKIICDGGVVKYALTTTSDSGNHAHFQCTSCGQVSCLPDFVGDANPPGFIVESRYILFKGVCTKCIRRR